MNKKEKNNQRFGLINEDLKAPYNTIPYRVFWMGGGFGIHSYTIGRAVMGFHLADGVKCRRNRGEFLRPATEEEIMEAWETHKKLATEYKKYLEENSARYEKLTSEEMYLLWEGGKIPKLYNEIDEETFTDCLIRHRIYVARNKND